MTDGGGGSSLTGRNWPAQAKTEDAMVRIPLVLAIVFSLVAPAFAQAAPTGGDRFVGTIDLGATVTGLARLADAGDESALSSYRGGVALMLFGTLSKPSVTSDEPFEAVAEFLEGEWIGESKLALHRIVLVFSGDSFKEYLETGAGKRALLIVKDPVFVKAADGTHLVRVGVVSARSIQ